jgi:putative Holliday junction resolvase
MRYLGVDLGTKRIGLATVDGGVGLPTALAPLLASGTLAKDAIAIAERARAQSCESAVLGLPLEPGGSEGKGARVVRKLAQCLQETGLEVHLIDESLTSVESHAAMHAAGLKASQRDKRVDGEAACRILERFLREQA